MGLYNRYNTNADLENTGVIYDLGDARVRLARAGGANNAYLKRMEALTKPHRRAIQNNSIERDVLLNIVRQVFAETVIKGWETRTKKGDFVSGIEDAEGNIQPYNLDNVMRTLTDLPDLFSELQEFAGDQNMYLQSILEDDAKNSQKS